MILKIIQQIIQMFDKMQMIPMMKTRISNDCIPRLNKEFGISSHETFKAMLDKSSVYVLAEGMYFLDKGNPSNFRFLDFTQLA